MKHSLTQTNKPRKRNDNYQILRLPNLPRDINQPRWMETSINRSTRIHRLPHTRKHLIRRPQTNRTNSNQRKEMNHAQRASQIIDLMATNNWMDKSPFIDRRIAAAQVHASLALVEAQNRTAQATEKLVEQQRIANSLLQEVIHHVTGINN